VSAHTARSLRRCTEAALPLRANLALMRRMHELVADGSQFIILTHSPILLGYPNALIYVPSDSGITVSDRVHEFGGEKKAKAEAQMHEVSYTACSKWLIGKWLTGSS